MEVSGTYKVTEFDGKTRLVTITGEQNLDSGRRLTVADGEEVVEIGKLKYIGNDDVVYRVTSDGEFVECESPEVALLVTDMIRGSSFTNDFAFDYFKEYFGEAMLRDIAEAVEESQKQLEEAVAEKELAVMEYNSLHESYDKLYAQHIALKEAVETKEAAVETKVAETVVKETKQTAKEAKEAEAEVVADGQDSGLPSGS